MSPLYTQYSLSQPVSYPFDELFNEHFFYTAHASSFFKDQSDLSDQTPSPCPLVHDKETTSKTILASTGKMCLHKARTLHQGPGKEGGLTCR